ncbi:MAG: alpha/beta hydrolase [Gammaproteobacteria bacterium]|nr:alpha/beta hydrolase [Gammaproteobacteria bacterium]
MQVPRPIPLLAALLALVAALPLAVWGAGAPPAAAVPPALSDPIPLYPGVAPGSEQARQAESGDFILNEWKARNVTRPELIPYLPASALANGTAVIVAPGGGFEFLSVQSEGAAVARWLAARGITAFMLKYRLNATPADLATYEAEMKQRWQAMSQGQRRSVDDVAQSEGARQARADGLVAVRRVRELAGRYGIAPNRIGIIGFSAGGVVALSVATQYDAASRPDFAASIYGALPGDARVPADAPPLFLAVSADDPLLATASQPVFNAWRAQQRPAELHIYEKGGHGYGLNKSGASSDHWIDAFYWWLEAGGFIKAVN